MQKNAWLLSEKLRAKFPPTTLGFSLPRISHLSNAFLGILQLEAKLKTMQKSQNFDFCICLSKNVLRSDASGKKAMLSCSKCLFSRLELFWLVSRLRMSKTSKSVFLPKISKRVSGLKNKDLNKPSSY